MKRSGSRRFFAMIGALCLGGLMLAEDAAFDQAHTTLDRILEIYVRDARVDYGSLRTHRQELDRYLGGVAAVDESEFKRWTEAQRLALLINAYNAYTLRLIVDHYPVKSIKDIGSIFKGPWDQPAVRLLGRTLTLNDLEHGMIRVDYPDPRTHFALVCAARGCPPLRGEAYVADRLDAQLDDQAREFLADTTKNRLDANRRTAFLSPIFKWYGEDFEKRHGSVLAALGPYWPKAGASVRATEGFTIRYTDYDWSLNDRRP